MGLRSVRRVLRGVRDGLRGVRIEGGRVGALCVPTPSRDEPYEKYMLLWERACTQGEGIRNLSENFSSHDLLSLAYALTTWTPGLGLGSCARVGARVRHVHAPCRLSQLGQEGISGPHHRSSQAPFPC